MRVFLLISFILISHFLSAQMLQTTNMQKAIALAKQHNKLLVIDFWAEWCSPCKKMNKTVWDTPEIKNVLTNFVFVKFDLTAGFKMAKPYKLTSIPCFYIVDGLGNIIHKEEGVKSKKYVLNLLKTLPNNIEKLNRISLKYNSNDTASLFYIAENFSMCSDYLRGKGRDIFLRKSNYYINKAKLMAVNDFNREMITRCNLLKYINSFKQNKDIDFIKNINEMLLDDALSKENKTIAYYIIILDLLRKKDVNKAQHYFQKLKELNIKNIYTREIEYIL